jgi:hypothetical protein
MLQVASNLGGDSSLMQGSQLVGSRAFSEMSLNFLFLCTTPVPNYELYIHPSSLFLPTLWFIPIINLIPSRSTGKSFPIKIIIRITMTFRFKFFLSSWTMIKWNLV